MIYHYLCVPADLPLLLSAPVTGLVFALRGPRDFVDENLVVEDLPPTRRAEMLAR